MLLQLLARRGSKSGATHLLLLLLSLHAASTAGQWLLSEVSMGGNDLRLQLTEHRAGSW
jgi:hypothetical protein